MTTWNTKPRMGDPEKSIRLFVTKVQMITKLIFIKLLAIRMVARILSGEDKSLFNICSFVPFAASSRLISEGLRENNAISDAEANPQAINNRIIPIIPAIDAAFSG